MKAVEFQLDEFVYCISCGKRSRGRANAMSTAIVNHFKYSTQKANVRDLQQNPNTLDNGISAFCLGVQRNGSRGSMPPIPQQLFVSIGMPCSFGNHTRWN